MILLALLLAAAPDKPAHHAAAPAGPSDSRPATARFDACIKQSDGDAPGAIATAKAWAASGGGVLAAQCLGVAQSAAGDYAAAADAFTAGATIAAQTGDPSAPRLWASAGNAALANGDFARARTALDSALADQNLTGELRGEALVDRARADVAGEDLSAARADLDAALALVPADPVAWLLSATLARRMDDGTRAAKDIAQAATLAPNEPAIFFEAGNIAATNGDMAEARAQWEKAQAADPGGDIGKNASEALANNRDIGAPPVATPSAPPPAPAPISAPADAPKDSATGR